MRSLIGDLVEDVRHGDWAERCVASLILTSFLALAALLGFGLFTAADSWFIKDQPGIGTVSGKDYMPAYTQVIIHSNGKTTWTQIIYHPESWYVRFAVGARSDSLSVREREYEAAEKGQLVPVTYRKGRMSDWLYVTSADFSNKQPKDKP